MELKYVGARPIVTKNGVCFDETKPDNYIFLTPIIDILDALESEEVGKDVIDIKNMEIHHFRKDELMTSVQKYCLNLEDLFKKREDKANQRIDMFIEDSKKYRNLNKDEEIALFGNIKIMRNYYLHYVLNEMVYHTLLHTLANRVHQLKFNTLIFPVGVNHGLVVSHLIELLEEYKSSSDATMKIEEDDGNIIGKLEIKRV
jgi:hypothetical protein